MSIIKQNTSKNTTGENNGCYGKRWLRNPLTNDKVYVQKDDVQKYKDLGYIEGSEKPTSLGYKWINNGLIEMQVHPEKLVEYINSGWVLGKMKNTRKIIDPITGKYKYVKPQFIQQYLDLGYILYDNKHRFFHIGDNLSIGKTAQAYSQYVKKITVPFVFEGLEIPGSNSGRLLFKKFNLKYNY